MSTNGFVSYPPDVQLFDANFSEKQRAAIIKKFQASITSLEGEIRDLSTRKADIEADIALAFAERLASLETRAKALQDGESKLGMARNRLIQEREVFELEKTSAEKKLDDRRAELIDIRKKNEAVLSSAQDEVYKANGIEVEAAQRALSLDVWANTLKGLEESLTRDRNAFNAQVSENKAAELRQIEASKDYSQKISEFKAAKEANALQQSGLLGLIEKLKTLKNEISGIKEKVRIEKSNKKMRAK